MSSFGGPAGFLQDINGLGVSDPYSDTNNIGSSWSDLAKQLISSAGNIGISYAAAAGSGGQIVATGNPLAPTTVIPSEQQQYQMLQAQGAMTGYRLMEYGAIGIIAIILIVAVVRK